MPLFGRNDGDLVRGEGPVRRIMPYLMRGRNESAVLHETTYRVTAARAWLRAYNRTHPRRATLFHLLAYACAQALHARPRLNRFVSGGRIWQRRGVQVAFVAKKEFRDDGVGATVKVHAEPAEPFAAFSARMAGLVGEARTVERAVDREVGLVMRLPGPLVTALVALARALDRWNLFPELMTREDPMFSSLFLANLGSLGISDVFHHLYEYGTVSIFGAVSAVRRAPVVEGDALKIEEVLQVRWTFDERIDDGFSCARSLQLVQRALEHPERWLGPPEGDPRYRPPAALGPRPGPHDHVPAGEGEGEAPPVEWTR
jgi:pyruvate/2-oxoglutarate dehydrogenase complex dihydrolipoamide acyltransferase (E2) component